MFIFGPSLLFQAKRDGVRRTILFQSIYSFPLPNSISKSNDQNTHKENKKNEEGA